MPTDDAKVADTFSIIKEVHSQTAILVDGDVAGRGYLETLSDTVPPPHAAVIWPDDWEMENVVSWIARADEAATLTTLGEAFDETFDDLSALATYLLSKKTYAPTHEMASVLLMANPACRARAAQLLNGLCNVLRDPHSAATPHFERETEAAEEGMHVFRFAPP